MRQLVRRVFPVRRTPFLLACLDTGIPFSDKTVDDIGGDAGHVRIHNATQKMDLLPAEYGWSLRYLLEPEWLNRLCGTDQLPAHLRVPGAALESDLNIAPGLLVLGADDYAVAYSRELDVVTSWEARYEGRVVERRGITGAMALR